MTPQRYDKKTTQPNYRKLFWDHKRLFSNHIFFNILNIKYVKFHRPPNLGVLGYFESKKRQVGLWRNVNWWVQWDEYLADKKNPQSLADYVNWSQQRQTEGLCIAVKTSKDRFPSCGGFIIWMGHDCFPCMVNTSIIDFDGNLKPAAIELSKIFKLP